MRWAQNVDKQTKTAFVLGMFLPLVLLSNLWEQSTIEDLDKSFSSIYDDRLLPATYVFKLTDHLYKKRLLWEELQRTGQAARIRPELDRHDAMMASLITEFEATYLVDTESQALKAFKAKWAACQTLERQWVLQTSADLRSAMTSEFDQALHQLDLLSQIQVQVAQDLKAGSKSSIASSSVLSRLEMLLLIVVGLVIQALVSGTRSPEPPSPQARG